MSVFPLPVPNILGHYYSFASIELLVNNFPFTGVTAINYSRSLEVADVYGTRTQKLGTTRGKQNAEATIEMYRPDWEVLKATLGAGGVGYGETRFTAVVLYAETLLPVTRDVLEGCRITKVDYQNADGTDPSKVSLTLNVMRISEGVGRIDHPLGVGF
jgi:hypothetical protein